MSALLVSFGYVFRGPEDNNPETGSISCPAQWTAKLRRRPHDYL